MNKFQKDLEVLKTSLNDKNQIKESLKEKEKENKLQIEEIESQRSDIQELLSYYIMLKKENRRYDRKEKSIIKKYTLFTSIIIILEVLLFLLPSIPLAISLTSVIISTLLIGNSTKKFLKHIKKLEKEREECKKGLSKAEIDKNIELLLFQKSSRLSVINDIEVIIDDIKYEIKKVDNEIQEISDTALVILEFYKNSLSQINPKSSDEEIEENLNKNYNENIRVMIKKISRKNV